MSTDELIARTKAVLEGITEGPWQHCTAPSNDSDETHAEWLAGTLIGAGEELHVVIAESNDPNFAYIVPAVTGDGPTSAKNADFIVAARSLMPELVDRLEFVAHEFEAERDRRGEHFEARMTAEAKVRELVAELERLQRFSAIVEGFITERAEYITALKNCASDDSADYQRWQGHAESRRQLLAMLPWPADTDDAERISRKARVTR